MSSLSTQLLQAWDRSQYIRGNLSSFSSLNLILLQYYETGYLVNGEVSSEDRIISCSCPLSQISACVYKSYMHLHLESLCHILKSHQDGNLDPQTLRHVDPNQESTILRSQGHLLFLSPPRPSRPTTTTNFPSIISWDTWHERARHLIVEFHLHWWIAPFPRYEPRQPVTISSPGCTHLPGEKPHGGWCWGMPWTTVTMGN